MADSADFVDRRNKPGNKQLKIAAEIGYEPIYPFQDTFEEGKNILYQKHIKDFE